MFVHIYFFNNHIITVLPRNKINNVVPQPSLRGGNLLLQPTRAEKPVYFRCYVQHWTPAGLEIWKAFHTQKKKKG